jgi:hypothetical protein
MKAFQTPAPRPEDVDVPLSVLEARIRFAARMKPLAEWLAHPELAHGEPETKGDAIEQRHLLYDADADSAFPAFPYPTALEAS